MTTKTKKNEETLTDIAARYMGEYGTKSATIRKLASEGHKRADIARALGIRYQHVRNVLVQEELKAQNENDKKS